MRKQIALSLRVDDAEPILRQAAYDAAKFGAWCDYFDRRTVMRPQSSEPIEVAKKNWLAAFLSAKRIVEAFGVEYEPTSEEETLGVYIPIKVVKSHTVKIAGFAFEHVDKSVPDPKNARPQYKSGVHAEACRQAADRVVRRWQAMLHEAATA